MPAQRQNRTAAAGAIPLLMALVGARRLRRSRSPISQPSGARPILANNDSEALPPVPISAGDRA